MILFVLGGLLAFTQLFLYLPQIARILSTRDTGGMSEAALFIGLANYLAWTFFFFLSHESVIVATNVVGAVAWSSLAFLVVYVRRAISVRALIYGSCWATVLTLAYGLHGATGLGSVLAVSVLVTYSPSVWEAWVAPHIGGISTVTWALFLLNGAIYICFGLLQSNSSGLFFGVLSSLASLGVLAAIVLRRDARVVIPDAEAL